MNRGEIRVKEAYAAGKMLDHSSWSGVLPRKITPCDIDAVFDDKKHGRIVLCEIDRVSTWREVDYGKRVVYERLVAVGSGAVFSVLATQSIPIKEVQNRDIDTLADIRSFQVMRFSPLVGFSFKKPYEGRLWERWITAFYDGKTDI